jgi:phenylalanyl-tRNA synthetase alpha chain
MLSQLKQTALKEIEQAKDLKSLEGVYRRYLGRKGELTKILRFLKDLPEKKRKERGKLANQIKREIEETIKAKSKKLQASSFKFQDKEWLDVTAPGILPPEGHFHPITLVQRQIEDIFQSMGFSVVDGPEMETEYYNFDALNTPPEHPARELTDTFWLKLPAEKDRGWLLRTHTSPMQVRYMKKHNPPLRIIVPGRCFRHEATDASHDVQFYQAEGLMVGQDVSMAHFKGIIEGFLKGFFGPEVKMRLRPSHFPFTEPSFEVDIKRKGKDWLEIMGAGMVHPNVFKAAGYVSGRWQGFAFGVGLDRLAMIKYQIDDIRLFYSGDLRFLKQF